MSGSKQENLMINKNMAFNPSAFEHVYGFDMFDTIHNFFPEILYDEELFSGELENWMRFRLSGFFPAMYSRQQNTYRIYRSSNIRSTFNSWRVGNTSPAVSSPFINSQSPTISFGHHHFTTCGHSR